MQFFFAARKLGTKFRRIVSGFRRVFHRSDRGNRTEHRVCFRFDFFDPLLWHSLSRESHDNSHSALAGFVEQRQLSSALYVFATILVSGLDLQFGAVGSRKLLNFESCSSSQCWTHLCPRV